MPPNKALINPCVMLKRRRISVVPDVVVKLMSNER
jgi:hypothetical protein